MSLLFELDHMFHNLVNGNHFSVVSFSIFSLFNGTALNVFCFVICTVRSQEIFTVHKVDLFDAAFILDSWSSSYDLAVVCCIYR